MDRQLQLARRGDKNALRALLVQHRGLLERVVTRYLWNKKNWEDTMQNIFIKVITSIDCFNGDCLITTWLYRVAVNTCVEANRKQIRYTHHTRPMTDCDELFPDTNAEDGLTSLLHGEVRAALYEAVATLPEGMRVAFDLFYKKQYSGVEAAEQLGITVPAFFVRLSAARSRLKVAMSKRGILSC